jgi:hypothetical protein
MDKPVSTGYGCQYIRSIGRGEAKTEVALSYQIVTSSSGAAGSGCAKTSAVPFGPWSLAVNA